MTGPRTAAGRALLTSLENINTRAYNPTLAGDILAIEAEAFELRSDHKYALPAEPAGATTNTMDPYCGCDTEGHDGPCATPAAALDVERLARAVPFMLRRRDEDWPTFARKVAAAIAAAYEGEK